MKTRSSFYRFKHEVCCYIFLIALLSIVTQCSHLTGNVEKEPPRPPIPDNLIANHNLAKAISGTWLITACTIGGKDAMDSVRRVKLHHPITFDAGDIDWLPGVDKQSKGNWSYNGGSLVVQWNYDSSTFLANKGICETIFLSDISKPNMDFYFNINNSYYYLKDEKRKEFLEKFRNTFLGDFKGHYFLKNDSLIIKGVTSYYNNLQESSYNSDSILLTITVKK